MLDALRAEHVYIACGYTDLRSGIDRLAALAQSSFRLDPFSGSLFLFCGRRVDRIKALYWDADGFVLLYKRLERGQIPVATHAGGSQGADAATASVAAGRLEHLPTQSA